MAYALANNLEFGLAPAEYYVSLRLPARIAGAPSSAIEFSLSGAEYVTTIFPARGFYYPSSALDFALSPALAFTAPPRPRDPGLFASSVGLNYQTFPHRGGDSLLIDVINIDVTFVFPGNMSQVEIKYPVIPVNESSNVLTPMGDGTYRVEPKLAESRMRRTSVLRFHVDRSYMSTFMDDLHSRRGSAFRLITLGYTPFGVNSSDNIVYCITHSKEKPIDRAQVFEIDITFLFVQVTP